MRFLSYSFLLVFYSFVKHTEGGGLLKINLDQFTSASDNLKDYCNESQYYCNIKTTFCVRFGVSNAFFDCSSYGVIINRNFFVHNDGEKYIFTDVNQIEIYTGPLFNGTFEVYTEIATYSSQEETSTYYVGYLYAHILSNGSTEVGIFQGSRQFDVFLSLSYNLVCSPGYIGGACNKASNTTSVSQTNNGVSLIINSPSNHSTILVNLTALSYKIVHCLVQGNHTEVYWLDENLNYASEDNILFLSIETIQHIDGKRPYYCYAANDDELVFIKIYVIVTGTQRGRRDILNDLSQGILGDDDNEFDFETFDSFNNYLLSITSDINSDVINSSDSFDYFPDDEYEVLEDVSSTYHTLVHHFTQRYNVLQQRNITTNLLNTANGILKLSARSNNRTQNKNMNSVNQVSSMAYTALEYLSLSIADNLNYLNSSENYFISYDSIQIYGQSWYFTELEDKTNIRVFDYTDGEQVEIPIELINQFRTNGDKFSIATTVVNTHNYLGFQETETDDVQLASRTMQIVLPTNYSIANSGVFTKPIKISFNVTSFANSTSNFTCVFLNSTSVEWSTNGVSNGNTTNATVDCYTTHLTNFAVLVSPKILDSQGTPSNLALTIISYILGIISFLLLILSLILFLAAGREFFKKESNIVYFNCCLSMLIAMGLYVFASDTFKFNRALCKAVAFLLHYTWLTVFAWMFCIGLLLLHTIIFGSMRKYKIYPWLLIIGWLCPVIIPFITFGVGYHNYLDDTLAYCFLQGDLFYAFFVPVYTVVVLNFVIFCFTLVKIFYAMKRTSNIKQSEIRKKILVTGITLTPILGLPWGLNIIGLFTKHIAITWMHVVLIGSMGIGFFFIAVVLNEEVQDLFCKSRRLRRRTLKSRISTNHETIQRPRAKTTIKSIENKKDSISKESQPGEVFTNSSEIEKNVKISESSSIPSMPSEDTYETIVMD